MDISSFQDQITDYFHPSCDPTFLFESAEFYTLEIGESLSAKLLLNDSYHFLVSGSIRELVSVSNTSQFSLCRHSSPFSVRFSDTSHQVNSRLLIASSRSFLFSIPSSKINELEHTVLSYDNIVSIYDLWSIYYANHSNPSAITSASTKLFLEQSTGSHKALHIHSPDQILDLISESHTLYLGEPNQPQLDYGKLLSLNQDLSLLNFPLRLLVSTHSNNSNSIQSPRRDPTSNGSDSDIPHSISDSSSDLSHSVSSTIESEPSNSIVDLESNRNDRIKYFPASPDSLDITISCFRSLSVYLNLPVSNDKISRNLRNLLDEGHDISSLSVCAALAESFGLQTQILKLPVSYLTRVDLPVFLKFNTGEVAIGLDTNKSTVLISRPSIGLQRYSVEQLSDLADSDECFDVLIFRLTDFTPTKKFGLRWFLPSLKKHKRSLIEVFIASFFVQLFQLMNPLVVQQIVDKVIGQGGTGTLPVLAFLIFTFALFENLLTALRTNLFIETTNRIDIALGEQVIDHLLRLPLSYFDNRPVGELSSRLGELEQIRSFLTGTALTVVLDFVFSFIYIAVMIIYSWVLTIVALLVAPLLALITFTISPVVRSQLREKAVLNAKTQNHLVEVLTGIQTVKAQNFETKARWRWKDRYSTYISESFKNAVTSTTSNSFTKFLNQASSLSVLCAGAFLVINGDLTLGQLIAFRIIAGYVTTPLLRLSNLYQNFQQTSISLERLADIIDHPVESGSTDQSNIPMPLIDGRIQYSDVSFSFKPNTPLQLSNVNIDIPPGKFVAIVGQSGSGKSTLTKLLSRLYSPLAGRILIDELDISKVELYSLRSQIGIVPQDSLLFEGSVQDNIALTNPEASTDDIIRAAKLACAHDFIMSLPSGYATSVGERGGALSGGQRQRIAIARSILQNPRMLIMDEATSALDYETERLVSLNLMEHFRGRTTLFITHRLNSIVHADLILLMHNGRLEEAGTHAELLDLQGRYFALFKQQGSSVI